MNKRPGSFVSHAKQLLDFFQKVCAMMSVGHSSSIIYSVTEYILHVFFSFALHNNPVKED